jgi:hypothetical protein
MGAVHHDVVRVHTRGAYMVTYAPSITHAYDIAMFPMGLDVAILGGVCSAVAIWYSSVATPAWKAFQPEWVKGAPQHVMNCRVIAAQH